MIIGTWRGITGHRNLTEWIQEQLGIWAPQYNLKAIEEELEQEIEDSLPDGYHFHNLAFHKNPKAPQPTIFITEIGDLNLTDLIECIDFWHIADANEKTHTH